MIVTENIYVNGIIVLLSLTGLIKFSELMIDGAVAIAKKYKISTTNVHDIIKRKIWKHV